MADGRPMPRMAILVSCVTLQVCFGTVYAWSFFQTMLVRQLGWTYMETALAFSLAIFFLGVAAAWAGMALPKLGPRKLALAGSIMFCGGYLIASLALAAEQTVLFYVGYGVIGGAGIGLGYVTPVATVAKWFPDRKGLATGTVVMGFGVGALLLSKLLAPVLVVYSDGDLPTVFFGLGIIFAFILVPASLLLSNPPPSPGASGAAAAHAGEGGSEVAPSSEYLKDQYPDRAVTYCFLIGILMLGLGYVFTYLLNDDRILLGRPTVEGTLRHFNIPLPRT